MADERDPAPAGPGARDAAILRDATPGDLDFLRRMTYEAAFWRGDGPRPDMERALADDAIAGYVPRFGAPGDIAVLAERGGRPVGAAWCRCFPAERPGYGFVAADVPEVAVAVEAPSRRRGVATALLQALMARAAARGFTRVSLSVNFDNPSARVYRRLGFCEAGFDEESWIMVRDL